MKTPDDARSRVMRAVRSVDTGPEMLVRRLAHRLGYRFRLHQAELPGRPDLVFPGRRRVIFVHGCFWHGHDCRRGNRVPATNTDYWIAKVARNRARDERVRQDLDALGWASLVLWECELRDTEGVTGRLQAFLGKPGGGPCTKPATAL